MPPCPQPNLYAAHLSSVWVHSQGGAIGDVYVSKSQMNHDRRIPLPGFEAYGLDLVQSVATPALQKALGLKAGIVSSGNSLDYTPQ